MSDCLFCQIVAGQIPAKVVAESDDALAFYDIAPQAPVHVLVVPKSHFTSVNEVTMKNPGVFDDVMRLAQKVAEIEGVKDSGYRLVFNVGRDGQQTVSHMHAHVFGGRLMTWPPG
jgi:histidine triad (HIT) family protein